MAPLPWFQVAVDFPDHPKTVRLGIRLKDPNAGMYIIRLLAHCATYEATGRIEADMVEHAAGWMKAPGEFIAAAEAVGFLERDGDAYLVHGWEERNGAHVRKAAGDNARPSASRRNPDKTPRGVVAGLSRDPDKTPTSPRENPALESKREIEREIKREAKEETACSEPRTAREPDAPPGEPEEPAKPPPSLPPDAPPLAHWLAEHYPDVPKPCAFAATQAEANPGIDLLAEARKALAWESSNPAHRKRNHARFLDGWFRRAQDRGTGPPRNGTAPKRVIAPVSEFHEGDVW